MSKPYDATTKHLLETYPADWLALMGLPGAQGELIDADLSTLTAAADRVLRVHGDPGQIVHFELQAGYLATLDRRTLFQNVALTEKYDLPVSSVLVLLHPQANSPRFTGRLELPDADGNIYLQFAYRVVRVWELDAETLLAGGTGTLPLTPLARVAESALPEVIRRMEQRIETEATAEEAAELWLATYVLMGMKFAPSFAGALLKGVRAMKESATYQAILQEGEQRGRPAALQEGKQQGRAEEARMLLLKLGAKRLGTPSADVHAAIEAEGDLVRLEALIERVLDVENWDELLND